MSDLRLEKMPLSDLVKRGNPRNPKDHNVDAIIASFIRFGFTSPVSIDETTDFLVAGHGRCEALALMLANGAAPPHGIDVSDDGEWMVPVVRGLEFKTERERDAFTIAENQLTSAGGWRFDLLSEMLGELREDGGFDGLGFEQIELDALLGQYEQEPPDDGQDPEQMTTTSSSDKPRTEITARIECPHCHMMIER